MLGRGHKELDCELGQSLSVLWLGEVEIIAASIALRLVFVIITELFVLIAETLIQERCA